MAGATAVSDDGRIAAAYAAGLSVVAVLVDILQNEASEPGAPGFSLDLGRGLGQFHSEPA